MQSAKLRKDGLLLVIAIGLLMSVLATMRNPTDFPLVVVGVILLLLRIFI